jgi:hypothetical protein
MVPEKARVNSETLTITFLFANLSLNDGTPGCAITLHDRLETDLLPVDSLTTSDQVSK